MFLHFFSQIKWSNRLLTDGNNIFSTVTVDGTDFRISEPTDFSTKWFYHKSKAPIVRYEVAISIGGVLFTFKARIRVENGLTSKISGNA
jgi:hypothetical protein